MPAKEYLIPAETNHNNAEELKDEEIAERTLSDKSYFLYIIERYKYKLQKYVQRLTNLADEDIEDILQDVFIKIYSNLRNYDSELKFSSWAYRIAHNQVIDNHRKIKARPQRTSFEAEEDALNKVSSDLDPRREVDQTYLSKNIQEALDKIDPKYKEIIVLRFFEEKDYKEISDIIKRPMGTVASMMNKAKKDLKKHLQDKRIT